MSLTLLGFLDLIGTIAFAIAGAIVAIRKKMDLFGINVLAVCTATGGGMIRDIIIGSTPPRLFCDPFYVAAAAVTASLVFLLLYFGNLTKARSVLLEDRAEASCRLEALYDRVLFWFDTLGLAAFTIDGVTIGIQAGYRDNTFLIIFLGMMTGVGGGALRDVLAGRMPDILHKHIYALSAIAGGTVTVLILQAGVHLKTAMAAGFSTVILLRCMAVQFGWNLPKVT